MTCPIELDRDFFCKNVSDDSLVVGNWLINAEPASIYPIYRARHISLIYRTYIYSLEDIPKRRPIRRRSTFNSNFFKSCSTCIGVDPTWLKRPIRRQIHILIKKKSYTLYVISDKKGWHIDGNMTNAWEVKFLKENYNRS